MHVTDTGDAVSSPGGIYLRGMVTGDIPAAMRLKCEAGWNQTAADWERFIRLSPDGCFVAVRNDDVVGTVTTIRYGGLSWIGMMLVDSAYRRRGIAKRLMGRAIRHLSNVASVGLDATPEGALVYGKFGFRDNGGLVRLIRDEVSSSTVIGESVENVTLDALRGIITMDTLVFGGDRRELLKSLAEYAPSAAVVLTSGAITEGYAFGRSGTSRFHIGPVVAENVTGAATLVDTVLSSINGRAALIDVPEWRKPFIRYLAARRFRIQRSFTRMYRGGSEPTGIPEKVFAVAGPEFG